MLFKLGLTLVVVVAIYLYFALQQEDTHSGIPDAFKEHEEVHPNPPESNYPTENQKVSSVSREHSGHGGSARSEYWRRGIHLSLVACGDRAEESVILLKSAVLFTNRPLVFHVFAEADLQVYFQRQIDFWPDEYRTKVEYHIYNLSFPEGETVNEWRKLFKPCASQRLFLPSLLKDVDALLYVDTDILFVRPLEDIWAHLQQFNRTQLVALCPEHEDSHSGWYNRFARHPYYGQLGVLM